jgi:hypothetical protein
LFEGELIFAKRAVKGLEVCASFLEHYQKSSQSLRREAQHPFTDLNERMITLERTKRKEKILFKFYLKSTSNNLILAIDLQQSHPLVYVLFLTNI